MPEIIQNIVSDVIVENIGNYDDSTIQAQVGIEDYVNIYNLVIYAQDFTKVSGMTELPDLTYHGLGINTDKTFVEIEKSY